MSAPSTMPSERASGRGATWAKEMRGGTAPPRREGAGTASAGGGPRFVECRGEGQLEPLAGEADRVEKKEDPPDDLEEEMIDHGGRGVRRAPRRSPGRRRGADPRPFRRRRCNGSGGRSPASRRERRRPPLPCAARCPPPPGPPRRRVARSPRRGRYRRRQGGPCAPPPEVLRPPCRWWSSFPRR